MMLIIILSYVYAVGYGGCLGYFVAQPDSKNNFKYAVAGSLVAILWPVVLIVSVIYEIGSVAWRYLVRGNQR